MSRRFKISLIVASLLAIAALVFCSFIAGILFSRIETNEVFKRQANNFDKEREQMTQSLRQALSEISELKRQLELEKKEEKQRSPIKGN